jgi:CheY-like chemotaxis protein
LDVVAFRAAEKRLNLQHALAPGVPDTVIGDAVRLRQVLVNLLGNAVKFTERGGVVLNVSVAIGADASACELTFAVRDSGIGISREDQKRLFTSFQQVDASATRRHTGTGLGLAISQRLVKLMGGEISVTSTPGQGSVFSFAIRTRIADGPVHATDQPDGTNSGAAASLALPGKRYPLSILVAEDNAVNQKVLVQLLRRIGYTATVVANGIEAVNAALATHFDLVLMDIQMPGMDGLAAMQKIRSAGSTSCYFVAVTANAFVEERDRLLGTGFDEYLSKPIPAERLRQIVEQVAERIHRSRS